MIYHKYKIIGGFLVLIFFGLWFFSLTRPVYSSFLPSLLQSKVVHYEAEAFSTSTNYFSYVVRKTGSQPKISADSYLVTDLINHEVVVSKNKDRALPIASVTKLMTAIVALELLKPEATTTVSLRAHNTYGNKNKLKTGEVISLKQLFYPLLLESSNAAAEVIAESAGRDRFIAQMNNDAKLLGMVGTHFSDPSGLSPKNVSTAEDLVKLANYIHREKNFIFEITMLKNYCNGGHCWHNVNNLITMKNYIGGKNGYTEEADRTLVSLFDLPLATNTNRTLALVLLSSGDRQKDTKSLINYLSKNVTYNGKTVFAPR